MTQTKFTIENNIIRGEKKPSPLQNKCIGDIILQVFNENPNHVSQIEVATGIHTTYAEMKRKSVACALWLKKQGIKNDDIVVICTPLQMDDYIPILATLFVGAIYNPWHHEITLSAARHLMKLTTPKFIFACSSAVDVLRDAAKLENVDVQIVCYDEHSDIKTLQVIIDQSTNDEIESYLPNNSKQSDDIAMILLSSGTTGLPKGVSYSIKMVKNLINGMSMPTNFTRLLWYSSLSWISGTFFLFQISVGLKTRIFHVAFEPEDTSRVIEEFKVEQFFIPPALVTHFCKAKVLDKYKFQSLKFIFTGGAKLGREFVEMIKQKLPHSTFLQGYGMTECGGLITMQSDECKKLESVGFIVPNTEIKIADLITGETLGANQMGEICFKTINVMIGYYKNPKATQDMIDEDGWYRTGDKGYYMENGEVMIVDRLKEVMKYRGHHIAPSEIEEHLTSHKAVMEAAVVPLPHDLDLEVPMAFVKRSPGAQITEDELVNYSCELGEIKKLRGGVKFLDELPHTASGKINRKLLKELAKVYSM